MWFITGIVLLYHRYPRVTDSDQYAHSEKLHEKDLPSIYDLPGFSDSLALKTLTVSRNLGETVWSVSQTGKKKETPMDYSPLKDGKFIFNDSVFIPQKSVTSQQLDSIVLSWSSGKLIAKIDTVKKRQQWILYERYEKYLPILRYYIDDDDKTEVFISKENGEVLQMTTREQRFWSWVGAIPHKLYFPFLRKDVKTWENVLLAGGLFCLFSALTGFYLGIYFLVVNYRKHGKFGSPFKRKLWKWHHIGGMIFGIFLISWGISGSLAMQRVPKWLVNYDGDYFVSTTKLWGKEPLPLRTYRLDYRELFNKYNDIKSISWEHFGNIPAYMVVNGDEEIYIDARQAGEVNELELSKSDISKAVKNYLGENVDFKMTLMQDYDEYYLSKNGAYPLPVWKIEAQNEDGTRMYISPSDGYVKYLNNNRIAKKWLFGATHYLDIKYFVEHQTIRYVCLWVLGAGCVFVCVSGIGIYLSKINKNSFS